MNRFVATCAAALVLLLSGTACDSSAQRARMVIHFAEPVRYQVTKGDSLAAIAERYNVTAEDVASWNGLESTTIEPGDILFLWKVPDEPPKVNQDNRLADARDVQRSDPRATNGRSRPRPRRTDGGTPAAGDDEPIDDDPEVDGIKRPTSVRNAGLFSAGVGDEGLDDSLANAVAGLQHERRAMGNAGMRDGAADMRAGDVARSGDMGRLGGNYQQGPYFPDKAVRTPSVRKPAPKRCLRQSTRANTGEDGMSAGKGLSSSQIKASLGRTLGLSRRCMPSGTSGQINIIVEIKVGCDGRVKNVYPINQGGVPKNIMSCIETVLGSTSFPAHDLPDGQSFQYPISYKF